MKFIQRNDGFATLEKQVPAPYFRRSFCLEQCSQEAVLQITGLGFYDVYVNGRQITKGFLAPYRSNLDHYVYYDEYLPMGMLQKNVTFDDETLTVNYKWNSNYFRVATDILGVFIVIGSSVSLAVFVISYVLYFRKKKFLADS